jgi:prophage antirepressor-like protein
MTDISTFNFNDSQLRSTTFDGGPWIVAKDVCLILGIHIRKESGKPNVTTACRKLDADERGVFRVDPFGTKPPLTFVSESGLYKLIMRSDKPNAKAFQNWVTKEVLPAVRKTGGYLLNEAGRPVAHADTKEAMPLPEGFAQMFQMLFAPIMKPLEDKIEAQGAVILSMRDHIDNLDNQAKRDLEANCRSGRNL